ncbi:MAG TPA: DUF2500 domain-containing protein [Clostridia bacterium]|nr:DUF2500 domain-containing protein [Clostridia bacterium]
MFSIFPAIVTAGFVVVLGIIIVTAVRGIAQWNRNNNSPVLCVFATIVAKRANTSQHHHHDANNMAMSHTTSSTSYYATFEVDSGDRMELRVNGEQYGLLAEGDKGSLTFQGTRYLGFERQK